MSKQTLEISSIRNCRCVICFSHDRKLLVMKNQTFMTMFCPEISFKPDDKVCWECEYIVRKIIKFKQKAMKTQKLLINWVKGVQVNSLSTLSVTDLVNISYTPDKDGTTDNIETAIDQPEIILSEIKDNLEDNTKIIKIELDTVKVEYRNKFDDFDHILCGNESNSNDVAAVTKTEELEEENCLETHNDTDEVENGRLNSVGNIDKEPENEKINKTLEDGQVKLYNREMELIATIEKMGEETMMRWREKERAKKSFLSHRLKCSMCLQKFMVGRICEEHKIKHSPSSGDFICAICEQRFMSDHELRKHRQEHYLCYKCIVCADEFRTQKDVQNHHNKFHTTPRCKKCGVVFETKAQQVHHKRTVHDRTFVCTVCERGFSANHSLKAHMLSHEDTRMMECEICHIKLKGVRGLRWHKKRAHSLKKDEAAYCAECNIQFRTQHTYRQHLKKAMKHRTADAFKYICDTCGSKYVYKRDLVDHINGVHLKTEKYRCKLCSKLFSNDHQLRRHTSFVHEKHRPPNDKICNYCGRRFTTKVQLTIHTRTHTGERPYECELCSMAFAQRSTLKTHVRGVHKHLKM